MGFTVTRFDRHLFGIRHTEKIHKPAHHTKAGPQLHSNRERRLYKKIGGHDGRFGRMMTTREDTTTTTKVRPEKLMFLKDTREALSTGYNSQSAGFALFLWERQTRLPTLLFPLFGYFSRSFVCDGHWLLVMPACFDTVYSSAFTVTVPQNKDGVQNRIL